MASEGAAFDPLHQFEVSPLVEIGSAGLTLDFTNSSLFMALAVAIAALFMTTAMSRRALVPTRLQSVAELFYDFIAGMIRDNAGPEARKYFPFVFSVFIFVLLGNLLGMIPGGFTFTSHIIVNATLALIVFGTCTVIGFIRHGTHYLSLFVPEGAPPAMLPLIVPIEVISYLSRPFSLAVRLFANMLAGHVMLKVFASFVVALGSLGVLGVLGAILPLLVNVALIGFEFLVAGLQAYVFALLTTLYLKDAIHLH